MEYVEKSIDSKPFIPCCILNSFPGISSRVESTKSSLHVNKSAFPDRVHGLARGQERRRDSFGFLCLVALGMRHTNCEDANY